MIAIRNLTFRYPGASQPALRGVSFLVETGETLGVLGPSGAGKSTLQNCMIGLLPTFRDAVLYDGVSLKDLGKAFFDRIGVSFEHPNLYSRLTGLENLRFHAGLYSRDIRSIGGLLDLVGLSDAAHRRTEEYSKGMKRRLVFARAIMHRPDILFLDEPTAGLDPGFAGQIREVIRDEQRRGATIILATHDMQVAEDLCDRVAFINEGELVAIDTPRNLKMLFGQKSVEVEYRLGEALSRKVLSLESGEDLAYLNRLLRDGAVETVHSLEASLARVFVELTGRGLSR
ncbi:MAG: ABC transporter ATP-binding protein [Clostridia bacterium]